MAASTLILNFFSIPSSSQPNSSSSTCSFNVSFALSSGPDHLEFDGANNKFACSSKTCQIKGNVAKAITATSGFKSEVAKDKKDASSVSTKTIPKFPNLMQIFAIIMNIKLTAEKQWRLCSWKPRRADMFACSLCHGRINDNVYRQNFYIRSYELQPDGKASIEALMKLLQETAINHLKFVGFRGDSFGSTPEMSRRNLTWVLTKMNVQVEHYPSCEDGLEINTWIRHHGKNSMSRDWHIRNLKTGQTIMRATSVLVLMNKTTRKLCKLLDEIEKELKAQCKENTFILNVDSRKIPNLTVEAADYIIEGLTPRWTDLDVNMHVNNVKYLGWLLEGIPISLLETNEVVSIVMEYRKECKSGNILQSLTSISPNINNISSEFNFECDHLLQLKSGPMLMKGRTTWKKRV